jgi:uncharacterized linocin/CFP29 family protein
MDVSFDWLNINGQAQGEVAAYIASRGRLDPGRLRPWINEKTGRSYVTVYKGHGDPTIESSYVAMPIQNNATLRYDDWKAFDDAVLRAARTRLGGIQDLIDNGLTYEIGNNLGIMVLQGSTAAESLEADLTMNGKAKGENDRPNYEPTYLPLPIAHADFTLDTRILEAARLNNHPIDTEQIETGTRKVNEKLETLLFTNTSFKFGGGFIYSYLSHPQRNPVILAVNWDASAKTPQQIKQDVLNMKQASINDRHYGPWMLYIPTAYETVLDDDYYTGVSDTTKAGTSDTIRDRIMKIDGIKGIKIVDTLPANNVVLVQMTSDVVRLVRGLSLQVMEWKTGDMLTNYYKVMTIQVPQVRADQNNRSGIVHLS